MIVRRIGVLSLGKIMGLLYGLLGLLIGAIVAVFSLFGAAIGSMTAQHGHAEPVIGALFGVGAVVFLPILYGIMGALAGFVTAALYNLVAGAVGGLRLDVTDLP